MRPPDAISLRRDATDHFHPKPPMHIIFPAPVRRSLLPALATLVLTSGLAAQNLILNGSFEAPAISNVTTSSPTSWTSSGSYAYLVNGTNGFVLNQGAP